MLSAPDSRASYLLDMADQAQNIEHSIADLDFLEDAMQMRMDLDDAIEGKIGRHCNRYTPKLQSA